MGLEIPILSKDSIIMSAINKSIVVHIIQRFRWLEFPILYFSLVASFMSLTL